MLLRPLREDANRAVIEERHTLIATRCMVKRQQRDPCPDRALLSLNVDFGSGCAVGFVQIGKGDRVAEDRRECAGNNLADALFVLARMKSLTGVGQAFEQRCLLGPISLLGTLEDESPQPKGQGAIGAHSSDHFLSQVAPFGVTHRMLFESGFGQDAFAISSVGADPYLARFNAHDFQHQRKFGFDEHLEPDLPGGPFQPLLSAFGRRSGVLGQGDQIAGVTGKRARNYKAGLVGREFQFANAVRLEAFPGDRPVCLAGLFDRLPGVRALQRAELVVVRDIRAAHVV